MSDKLSSLRRKACRHPDPASTAAVLGLTLRPRRLELIALLPFDQFGQASGFPSQRESEPRHGRIADEIHLWMVLIAGLVIMLLHVIALLLESPGLGVAFVLQAFINGERR